MTETAMEVSDPTPARFRAGLGTVVEVTELRGMLAVEEPMVAWLAALAGIGPVEWYRVVPEKSHPEDELMVMVADPEDPAVFRLVRIEYDSDVGRLARWIRDHGERDERDEVDENPERTAGRYDPPDREAGR